MSKYDISYLLLIVKCNNPNNVYSNNGLASLSTKSYIFSISFLTSSGKSFSLKSKRFYNSINNLSTSLFSENYLILLSTYFNKHSLLFLLMSVIYYVT